jgi:hypothetical protein
VAAVLTQAPHCPNGSDLFHVEGSLDGVAVEDSRTTNINAGLINIGDSYFYTPVSSLAQLTANQVALRIEWTGSLAYGQSAAAKGGTMTSPASHPRSAQQFCITRANVGFVEGGSEDGVFKFSISGVKAGDCNGAEVPVDLRGCMN